MQEPVRITQLCLCNANMSIYIINISFIFIKRYNFPFTHVVVLYGTAKLFTDTDRTRCLRASVATYLAFVAVREARVIEFSCRPYGLTVRIN